MQRLWTCLQHQSGEVNVTCTCHVLCRTPEDPEFQTVEMFLAEQRRLWWKIRTILWKASLTMWHHRWHHLQHSHISGLHVTYWHVIKSVAVTPVHNLSLTQSRHRHTVKALPDALKLSPHLVTPCCFSCHLLPAWHVTCRCHCAQWRITLFP